MSNKLSFRFYTVERMNGNVPMLVDALAEINARDYPQRQIQVGQGYVVRLERHAVDAGGEVQGEFIRVSDTNFPFEVRQDGVRGLEIDNPLGSGVAFRFRPNDHTLAIQYDTRIVSPGRVMDYLLQIDGRFAYRITPQLDAENWEKFLESPVRKLRIGIASPNHLGAIEPQGASVAQTFQQLGEAYNAPVITIEMGMGNNKGSLGPAAKELATAFFGLFQGGGGDVRSLRASVKTDDDEPVEDINLIDEVLSERRETDLPRNDPERNYQVRAGILRQVLNAR
ncbi:hypothetical protein [Ensifer soli]|uniref:hypothetical protein n=1 Tax=Ciceribacter sp. sgz301302 TaxID=3342379 RepID=UPI0035BA9E04